MPDQIKSFLTVVVNSHVALDISLFLSHNAVKNHERENMTTKFIQKLIASDRRNRKILDLLAQGVSQSEIARKFKISRQRVHQIKTRG